MAMTRKLTVENFAQQFLKNIQNLQLSDKFCDVTIISGNNKCRISAHRMVLGATSEHFATLFANAKDQKEFVVHGLDDTMLKSLLTWCYSGTLQLDASNISRLYMGAVQLQLQPLLTKLNEFIIKLIDNTNCLHFYRLAEHFSQSVLCKAARDYICVHFPEVIDRPSFLQLDTTFLKELLTWNGLHLPSAEYVFRRVIQWVQYDTDEHRNETLLELLPNLRLSNMSRTFLLENVNPVCKTIESKNLVIAAGCKKRLESTSSESLDSDRERLIAVANDISERPEIMMYNFDQHMWTTLAVINTNVSCFTVIHSIALDSLCFFGGFWNNFPVSDVLLWSLRTRDFTRMTNMTTARSSAGVVSLNNGNDSEDDFLVFGGRGDGGVLSSVEHWSAELGKWQIKGYMDESRFGPRLIKVGNLIYCIGGYKFRKNMKLVQCYNLTKKSCWTLAPLHYGRYNCAVINEGDKVYVIGGGSNVIECYDPHAGKWTEICTLEDSCYVRSCVRHNNCLLAFEQNIVFCSEGDWKVWKRSDTIEPINKVISEVFSIPLV